MKPRESAKIADFYTHLNLVASCFEVIKTVYSIMPVDKVRAQWKGEGISKISNLLHKSSYFVEESTKGRGVRNTQKSDLMVYGYSAILYGVKFTL